MSEPLFPLDARTLVVVAFTSSILMAAVLWFVFAFKQRQETSAVDGKNIVPPKLLWVGGLGQFD